MASYKINFARINNCPDANAIFKAMKSFGMPNDAPMGILGCKIVGDGVSADIVFLEQVSIRRLNREELEIEDATVEKATVYPVGIFPARGILETYDGGASGIEEVAAFLAGCLLLPTFIDHIEIDLPATVQKLREKTQRFQLKKLRATEYAHSSYASGPYAPAFLDTPHGEEFLEEYVDYMAAATVQFQMDCGKSTLHLGTKACFRFSVKDDQDKDKVHSILRELL